MNEALTTEGAFDGGFTCGYGEESDEQYPVHEPDWGVHVSCGRTGLLDS